MPFNDTSEGQTHYAGDGCQPPHVITSDSATPQPATMEKCQQYLAICKNCGRSQSAHAFAPPQSEERETLGEDIARLVDKRISKNELVLELVALFHRNNNVMPSHPDTLRNWEWVANEFHEVYERLSTHYGYSTRPDTKDFDPTSPNGKLMIATVKAVIEPLIAQERERIDDKWGKAWAELVENTDKETKELKERWESELRKEIVRLGTYDENNKTWLVVYTKEFTDSLISNKRKE